MIKSKKGSFFVKMKFYYKKFKIKKIFLRKYWYFISKKWFLENIILNLKKYFSADFWKKHDFLDFAKKFWG